MHLSGLTLTNVRQFDRRTFQFQSGFNLLVGENGAGKTTVLRGLLAVLGGSQQNGRRPKLEDDDIRLRTRWAEVSAEVQLSHGRIKKYHSRKALWEPAERSPRRRDQPQVLLYGSTEATCPAMRVRRLKQIRGGEYEDLRLGQAFLYEAQMEAEGKPTASNERRFGNSQSVRNFVGEVLSTFSPDFRHFFWRFEPYDCWVVPASGSEMKQLVDLETQDQARSVAMRYFQEDLARERRRPFEWPDQSKVVLTPNSRERSPDKLYLPDLNEIWEGMKVSPERRKSLQSCSLEVKLSPRIMIRRRMGLLSLSQLSDGEQRLFSLFVDIARQLSLRNPHGEIGGGEAIVLIDEIDVHLHPKWQRKIVPALEDLFRSCQFIATTHSPFVIQSANRSRILRIGESEHVPLDNTSNSIEDIAEEIQGIRFPQRSARAEKLSDAATKYFTLLKHAKHVAADTLSAAELEYRIASEPFTSEPGLDALLKLELFESRK